MKTLKEIHAEAVSFVDENWRELNALERRISTLAIMKMIIQVEALKHAAIAVPIPKSAVTGIPSE